MSLLRIQCGSRARLASPEEQMTAPCSVKDAPGIKGSRFNFFARLKEWKRKKIIDDFHRLYFHTRHIDRVQDFWLGVPVIKYPGDLMMYQELFWELRPDWIIETGTNAGGSALFYASIFDLIGHGRVISIDVDPPPSFEHRRATFLTGSSTAPETVKKVRDLVKEGEKVMVTLDSCHAREHVRKEMEMYSPLVTEGSYLIVEDTKLNGNPVFTAWEPDIGPGPMEALEQFLSTRDDFEVDSSREKYLLTSQPRGFLRKIA